MATRVIAYTDHLTLLALSTVSKLQNERLRKYADHISRHNLEHVFIPGPQMERSGADALGRMVQHNNEARVDIDQDPYLYGTLFDVLLPHLLPGGKMVFEKETAKPVVRNERPALYPTSTEVTIGPGPTTPRKMEAGQATAAACASAVTSVRSHATSQVAGCALAFSPTLATTQAPKPRVISVSGEHRDRLVELLELQNGMKRGHVCLLHPHGASTLCGDAEYPSPWPVCSYAGYDSKDHLAFPSLGSSRARYRRVQRPHAGIQTLRQATRIRSAGNRGRSN